MKKEKKKGRKRKINDIKGGRESGEEQREGRRKEGCEKS